jgi:hypothetical protein
MRKIVRPLIRKFVNRMSGRTRVTAAFFAYKYKTDPRTAQLALEQLFLHGVLKRTRESIRSEFTNRTMWVYQKI